MSKLDSKLVSWFMDGKTGTSSECMAKHLTGQPHDKSYPSDGGDFKRCLGLLDAVPELRKRLNKMKEVSPQWEALIDNWEQIESFVRKDQLGAAWKLMKKILHPIEDADKNIIRLGDTMSIHFGDS